MPDAEERGFLAALKQDPKDATSRLAYADWLEEHDRSYEAMLQRVKAGVSEARFKIRRKSDGLFSEGYNGRWSHKGKEWRTLSTVKGFFTTNAGSPRLMDNTNWEDVEVVVFEVRVLPITEMAVTRERSHGHRHTVTVQEPKAP
jgi:uncharacterized protein (TIGR02996 family)